MRFLFELSRRNANPEPLSAHLRRDFGLPEFDRSDNLISRALGYLHQLPLDGAWGESR